MKPKAIHDVPTICRELQELQRQRVVNLKSRIMIANRLTATIATAHGYHAGMEEKERARHYKQANELIAKVQAGDSPASDTCCGLILATSTAIDGFDAMVAGYEREMSRLAKQLPVAAWVASPEQRGFGLLSLAMLVGEAGDLSNYSAPGKLWKRLGLAPYSAQGDNLMPSTWRRRNGLSAEEWSKVGYSPRRRSMCYIIGDCLLKGNRGGPYRRRYDEAKAKALTRPEWTTCQKCNGSGMGKRAKCANCNGTGMLSMRCHLHGTLLATKLLVKNLWIQWSGGGEALSVYDRRPASAAS